MKLFTCYLTFEWQELTYDVLEREVGLESEGVAGAKVKGVLWSGTHSEVRLPRVEFQLYHTYFITLGRSFKLSVSQFPSL